MSATIFADDRQTGMPPPGCTEPPQKYKFLIFLLKLLCLKKAPVLVFELMP
jgi:hypothetical protein